MKKILLHIGIAIAAIGCTKNDTPTDSAISFTAGVATRVSDTDDCAWVEGDEIGIFTNQADEENLLFKISDAKTGAMTNSSSKDLVPLSTGYERTYFAYHPYTESGWSTNSSWSLKFDVTSNQSTPLLWAKETSNYFKVALQFTHMLPKVTFNLTAGGEDVTSLTDATAWLTGAVAKGEFLIGTGEFLLESNDDIDLTIIDIDEDPITGTITAYIPPSENVKLWITAQGNTFVISFDKAWESGNSYEYDITVGAKSID